MAEYEHVHEPMQGGGDVPGAGTESQGSATVETETSSGTYLSIGERMGRYDLALTNAIGDEQIKSALQRFNYTPERIGEGIELLNLTREADARNQKEYGEQYAAGERIEMEYKEASRPYMETLGVARIALRGDREAEKALVLRGDRKQGLAEWVRDSDIFYRNLLNTERFLERMAHFGKTRDILEAEYKEVKDVEDAIAEHKREMGEAQMSTAIRDDLLEELDDWMSDFLGIARIALADQPEAKKKLGI
jgi:hypothetical protein